jgi:hypothetical protein
MIGPSYHRSRADAAAREAASAQTATVETRCSSSARWWAKLADAEESGDWAELARLSDGIAVFAPNRSFQ